MSGREDGSRRLRRRLVANARASAVALLGCSGLALAPAPTALSAQAPGGGLERVEQLVGLGRTEEAREALLAWWDGRSQEASRVDLQRGLWLRGRLTTDAALARLDYQRLVVLYPGGPYTDRALLRLAQAAHALGDEAAARQHVAALTRDYPDSQVRREAEAWLSAAGPAPPPPSTPDRAAAGAPSGAAPAGTSATEAATPASGRPTASTSATAGPAAGAAAATALEFFVQLGAFRDQDGALLVFEKARAAGFEPRIVHVEGSPLLHVRVGAFAVRDEAQRMLDRLGREGILSAVVRDQRAEQLVQP